jgi:GT2 family glycosyltransferase
VSVSVVIPLFNRYDLTVDCLAALGDVDVVLVDNASTDATAQMPVTVRNEQNEGFARACNQGAEAATGEIVVFLNNDTIPHEGWLEPIVRAFDDSSVGAVGSKLVYPDGSIQHAGVAIDFKQPPGMEAWNLKSDWTNELSDVDAVTGACLAMRRSDFLRLAGFDPGYWNGYEDVDLCLNVWAHGLRVVYQPASVVTHLESQSGPERWSAVTANVARLRKKWSTG